MNTNECFTYQKQEPEPTFQEAITHPAFSHTRFYPRWYHTQLDSIQVYFRCSDSPSGVLAVFCCDITPEIKAVMITHKIEPNRSPSRGEIACGNIRI